jgi:hypothetical protein
MVKFTGTAQLGYAVHGIDLSMGWFYVSILLLPSASHTLRHSCSLLAAGFWTLLPKPPDLKDFPECQTRSPDAGSVLFPDRLWVEQIPKMTHKILIDNT